MRILQHIHITMFRFTARSLIRDVVLQTKWSVLTAVTSRSHSHSEREMERARNHYSAESEMTGLSNVNVKSDIATASSNSCVEIEATSDNSHVGSEAVIQSHANKNLEEEISCSHSRVESEEMTIKSSRTEHDAVTPRSDLYSNLDFTNSTDKIPSGHCPEISPSYVQPSNVMLQIHIPMMSSIAWEVITHSHALAESEMSILNSDSHAGYIETTFNSNSNVESSDPYEVEILSFAYAKSDSKSQEGYETLTRCNSLADCMEVIPSTHFPVESDDVTSRNISNAKSETLTSGNTFPILTEKEEPHNHVVSDDMRDSVWYTDSEMVIPDLESKLEITDVKENSISNPRISEEKLDSVAFTGSEMIVSDNDFKEESKICCSDVESEEMTKRSDFQGEPMTFSFSKTFVDAYLPPEIYKDNKTKISAKQLNEESDIMYEFLNDMKEHIQHLTQEEFLEMLKIKKFGPYINPYTQESGGPKGPEPTRYGDWEIWGKCVDF